MYKLEKFLYKPELFVILKNCRKLTCNGDRNGSEDWLNMVNQSTDRLRTHVTSQELKKKLVQTRYVQDGERRVYFQASEWLRATEIMISKDICFRDFLSHVLHSQSARIFCSWSIENCEEPVAASCC